MPGLCRRRDLGSAVAFSAQGVTQPAGPSAKLPLMNHSQAIPDANDNAASASPAAMYQSSAALKLRDSELKRSRHTGPVLPRRR